jgi:hypothetical protein
VATFICFKQKDGLTQCSLGSKINYQKQTNHVLADKLMDACVAISTGFRVPTTQAHDLNVSPNSDYPRQLAASARFGKLGGTPRRYRSTKTRVTAVSVLFPDPSCPDHMVNIDDTCVI